MWNKQAEDKKVILQSRKCPGAVFEDGGSRSDGFAVAVSQEWLELKKTEADVYCCRLTLHQD